MSGLRKQERTASGEHYFFSVGCMAYSQLCHVSVSNADSWMPVGWEWDTT